jgi:aryl-alcohol dehydrogenase-like predicted oxidoreductase
MTLQRRKLGIETDVIPVLRELGISLVPISPLGRGFLTGAVRRAEDLPADDFRHDDPRYQGATTEVQGQRYSPQRMAMVDR